MNALSNPKNMSRTIINYTNYTKSDNIEYKENPRI